MARSTKPRRKPAKLPNAPLAEVVFEMRWQTPSQSEHITAESIFNSDPGFLPAQEEFTKRIARHDYKSFKDLAGPNEFVPLYSIARRYYVGENVPFPLMQIGPGIFATNQATDYEWESFKKQVLVGLRTLISSYPKLTGFPLLPNYLELRYIDVFEATLVKSNSFPLFLSGATKLTLGLPSFLTSKDRFVGELNGRVNFNQALKGWKNSRYWLDIGSATRPKDEPVLRLESKVRTRNEGVPSLRRPDTFVSGVEKWLTWSHDLLSPMFKELVQEGVMKKFEGKN